MTEHRFAGAMSPSEKRNEKKSASRHKRLAIGITTCLSLFISIRESWKRSRRCWRAACGCSSICGYNSRTSNERSARIGTTFESQKAKVAYWCCYLSLARVIWPRHHWTWQRSKSKTHHHGISFNLDLYFICTKCRFASTPSLLRVVFFIFVRRTLHFSVHGLLWFCHFFAPCLSFLGEMVKRCSVLLPEWKLIWLLLLLFIFCVRERPTVPNESTSQLVATGRGKVASTRNVVVNKVRRKVNMIFIGVVLLAVLPGCFPIIYLLSPISVSVVFARGRPEWHVYE